MKWVTCATVPCGKRVKIQDWELMGSCYEHSAHGQCCKCGKFWLDQSRLDQPIFYDNVTHTPFSCR